MNHDELKKFFQKLSFLRAIAGDMTLQRLQVLLLIAESGSDGITLTEIARRADLQASNVSKLCHSWSKLTSRKEPGPGYVTIEADPMNLSTKYCRLTPKGREVLAQLFPKG